MDIAMTAIITLLIGLALILADLLWVPGGVLSFCAAIVLIKGCYDTWTQAGPLAGLAYLAVLGVVIPLMIKMALNRLTNRDDLEADRGFVAQKDQQALLGQEGEAITPLRPGGAIMIGDTRYDAQSAGPMIESGQKVKIVKVEGAHLFVEEVNASEHPEN